MTVGDLVPSDDDRPHLVALREAHHAGFVALEIRGVMYGKRTANGAVDTYVVYPNHEAVVGRYAINDDGSIRRNPLWLNSGKADKAITALLTLPPHGSPGAPKNELQQAPHAFLYPPHAPNNR